MISNEEYIVLKNFSYYPTTSHPINFFTNEKIVGTLDESNFHKIALSLYNKRPKNLLKINQDSSWIINHDGQKAINQYEEDYPHAESDMRRPLPIKPKKSVRKKIKEKLNEFYQKQKTNWFYHLIKKIWWTVFVVVITIIITNLFNNRISFDVESYAINTIPDIYRSEQLHEFIAINSNVDSIPNQYTSQNNLHGNISALMWLYCPVRYNLEFINNNNLFTVRSYKIIDIELPDNIESKITIPETYKRMFLLGSGDNDAEIVGSYDKPFSIPEGTKTFSFISLLPFKFNDLSLIDSLNLLSREKLSNHDIELMLENHTAIKYDAKYGNEKIISQQVLETFFNNLNLTFTVELFYKNGKKFKKVKINAKVEYYDNSSS